MPYLHFKAYKNYHQGHRVKNESVFRNLKKIKEKKRKKIKERKEKNNQKISTRFVISTNNLIMYMYVSSYLKHDANPLTYSITWDENNNNNK